jgi:hypothetical protein
MFSRQKNTIFEKNFAEYRANAITQLTQYTAMRYIYLRIASRWTVDDRLCISATFQHEQKTSTKCMKVIWGNRNMNSQCVWICFRFWICRTAFLYTVNCYQKTPLYNLTSPRMAPCTTFPPQWLTQSDWKVHHTARVSPSGPEIHRQTDRIQNRERGIVGRNAYFCK